MGNCEMRRDGLGWKRDVRGLGGDVKGWVGM